MNTNTNPARPAPIRVLAYTAYAQRGPRPGPENEAEWYWVLKPRGGADRRPIWTGWATAEDAADTALDIVQVRMAEQGAARQERPGSIAALMTGWLAAEVTHRQDLDPKTRKAYDRDASRIVEAIGTRRASATTNTTLRNYVDGRLSTGAAPSTVRQETKRFLMAWRWAAGLRLVPDRPLRAPKLRLKPVRSQHTPTEAEVMAVHEALAEPWARTALALIWATGARVDEVATLTWGAVQGIAPRRYLVIDGKSTASNPGGVRRFPVGRRVQDALDAAPKGAPSDTITGVSPNRIKAHLARLMGEACAALGLPHFTGHRVRAAVEDRMAATGLDVKVYCALLGHTEEVALKIYRRVNGDDLWAGIALDDL